MENVDWKNKLSECFIARRRAVSAYAGIRFKPEWRVSFSLKCYQTKDCWIRNAISLIQKLFRTLRGKFFATWKTGVESFAGQNAKEKGSFSAFWVWVFFFMDPGSWNLHTWHYFKFSWRQIGLLDVRGRQSRWLVLMLSYD